MGPRLKTLIARATLMGAFIAGAAASAHIQDAHAASMPCHGHLAQHKVKNRHLPSSFPWLRRDAGTRHKVPARRSIPCWPQTPTGASVRPRG
jgi:hypothetical protein